MFTLLVRLPVAPSESVSNNVTSNVPGWVYTWVAAVCPGSRSRTVPSPQSTVAEKLPLSSEEPVRSRVTASPTRAAGGCKTKYAVGPELAGPSFETSMMPSTPATTSTSAAIASTHHQRRHQGTLSTGSTVSVDG